MIDHARRTRVDETGHLGLAAGGDDIAGTADVDVEKIVCRAPDPHPAGDVKNRVGGAATPGQGVGVMQVPDDDLGAAGFKFRQRPAGQHPHTPSLGQQPVGDFAADEPAGPGDEGGKIVSDGEHAEQNKA